MKHIPTLVLIALASLYYLATEYRISELERRTVVLGRWCAVHDVQFGHIRIVLKYLMLGETHPEPGPSLHPPKQDKDA